MPYPSDATQIQQARGMSWGDGEARSAEAVHFTNGYFNVDTTNGLLVRGPSPYVDARAYGANGNDALDDRAALASADAAAVAAGAAVFFSPGTYLVNSNLTLHNVWFAPGAMISPATGIVVTISGTITANPAQQIFTGAGTISMPTAGPGVWANWWGAVGDGSHDDTSASQAAVNTLCATTQHAGNLHFAAPSLYYKLTSTLTVFSGTTQNHINLYFDGFGQNGINVGWFGATNVSAIELSNNFGGLEVRNLSLGNFAGAVGTTIGLLVTSNAGSGTGVSPALIENFGASGFNAGLQLGGGPGGSGGAASEIVVVNPIFQNCTDGCLLVSFNTLDITFINLSISGCTAGIKSAFTSQLNVLGGSSSACGTDFDLASSGTNQIVNFRSETATAAFVTTGGVTTLIACNVADSVSGASITSTGQLTMIGCEINGYVSASGGTGTALTMIDCIVAPGPNLGTGSDYPFDSPVGGAMFDCRGNSAFAIVNPPGYRPTYDDMIGFVEVVWPTTPTVHRFQSLTRDSYKPTYSQDLSEMQGISGTGTRSKNLRGSVTFATAATAAVVFGQPEIQTLSLVGATSGSTTINGPNKQNAAAAWNTAAATLQTNLNALTWIGAGGVVCSGGPGPTTPIVITWQTNGPQYLMYAYGGGGLGGIPNGTVTETQSGTFAEADANYTVTISGNVNETFWVTAKATGGFTIHSSNATSTATVDWQLIR